MNSVFTLLRHSIRLEYRHWAQAVALAVLVWILSYIIYRLQPSLTAAEFQFVFWIILLLLSINIAVRGESHHSEEERLALYTLVKPESVILSRIIFNFLYLEIIAILFYLFLYIYFSTVVDLSFGFLAIISMGALVISSTISLISAIGVYASGQNTLLTILTLPLLVPVVLILSTMGNSLLLTGSVEWHSYLLLLGIGVMALALSIVLFPIIWKQ